MATCGTELDPFVRRQLELCDCLNYADLFKDYSEDNFRDITFEELIEFRMDDKLKGKINERVFLLRYEAPETTASIKTERQVKKEKDKDHAEDGKKDEDEDSIVISSDSEIPDQMEPQEEFQDHSVQQQAAIAGKSNLTTVDDVHGPLKRKVHEGEEDEEEEVINEVPSPKSPRYCRGSFWSEFAKFILIQPVKMLQWKFSPFHKGLWTFESRSAKSLFAFTTMTRASFSTSSLNKPIKVSQVLQLDKFELPEELLTHAQQCGLLLEPYTLDSNSSATVKLCEILPFIFTVATKLKKIKFYFDDCQSLNQFLDNLYGISTKNLKKLHLISNHNLAIATIEIQKLASLAMENNYLCGLEALVLECNLQIHQDKNMIQELNLLLYRLADSLKEFKVVKSFLGSTRLASQGVVYEIKLPEMHNLEKIDITSIYKIICTKKEEIKEAHEIIDLENGEEKDDDPDLELLVDIPVLLNFNDGHEFGKLKSIKLGCNVNINIKLSLENFPLLEEFVVGSPWNLRNVFNSNVEHARLKSIQFPDALADPTIFHEVKIKCPELIQVKLQLPSVGCLQEFFKVFANSKLERFYLVFDYVFEAGLVCPVLGIPFKLTSETDLNKMAKLKHNSDDFTTFVKINKIDVPEIASSHNKEDFGLKSLKCLKYLSLIHHSREIKYPTKGSDSNESDSGGSEPEFLSFHDGFPLGHDFYKELAIIAKDCPTFNEFFRDKINPDLEALEEFYKETGWKPAKVKQTRKPNKICSSTLISRRTKVKTENV